MGADLFDGRRIKGPPPQPATSPAELQAKRAAQERADREATEIRLKGAEAIWRTVQQAAGGGAMPDQPAAPDPVARAVGGVDGIWTGHPDDFCY